MAYREGPWKIVVDEKLAKPELYGLASDLAGREPERLVAMMTRLRASTAEIAAESPSWPAGEKQQRQREGRRQASGMPAG